MRRYQYGVTLLELMIVVVIVGILTTIAYPNYRQYVLRSKRADAKIALQQNAQALENCFTRFHSYSDAGCAIGVTLGGAGVPSADRNYNVTGALADATFTLTATPQSGQAGDTDCANFTIDQSNVRGVSGPKGMTECWR